MQSYSHSNTPRLRRFAVTVDGVRHEVIVEELDADGSSPAEGATTDSPSQDRAATIDADATTSVASFAGAAGGADGGAVGGGVLADGWVVAPMPGTVTEIVVGIGDTVNEGDVIVILTAMKLENEITAPTAGVIRAIDVKENDNVNNGDRLVQLAVEGDV